MSEDGKGCDDASTPGTSGVNISVDPSKLWPFLLALFAGGASGGGISLVNDGQDSQILERVVRLEVQMQQALDNDKAIQQVLAELARR